MPPLKPILLVEDNLNDAELVLNALEKNKLANNVTLARHGGEALDYLYHRGKFEGQPTPEPLFIMLDLKMPKVDGLEVLRQIKADERLKVIPVIMLTSSREEGDLVKSYQLGVNAYVVKPVDFSQFVDAIRHLGIFWALINVPPSLLPANKA